MQNVTQKCTIGPKNAQWDPQITMGAKNAQCDPKMQSRTHKSQLDPQMHNVTQNCTVGPTNNKSHGRSSRGEPRPQGNRRLSHGSNQQEKKTQEKPQSPGNAGPPWGSHHRVTSLGESRAGGPPGFTCGSPGCRETLPMGQNWE